MYPERYRLRAITRHVLELLERRRPALPGWDAEAEQRLRDEAKAALQSAGQQFRDIAEDPAYWSQVERSVLEVALPRYFRLAKEQSELEARKFDLWRGGDFLSRLAYGAGGLLLAALIWRVPALPKWLEPLPLLLFVFGPVLPDLQTATLRRRYRRQLLALLDEMDEEAEQLQAYRPLDAGPLEPSMTEPSHSKEKA